ncbi:MAG: CvpA family protein, partial [Desulfobacterales bacterium]|nr:CvpA family protein [Desulfobacterales bacterium]
INLAKGFDKSLGVLLGVVKAAIVIILLHMVLGSVLSSENDMLRECRTCEALNTVTDYAREIIRDEDVRKSLIQQTPAISTEDVIELFDQAWQDGSGAEQENQSTPIE